MTASAPPGPHDQAHGIWDLHGDETEGYYIEGWSKVLAEKPEERGNGWFCFEVEKWADVQRHLKELGFTEHEGHMANRRSMTT